MPQNCRAPCPDITNIPPVIRLAQLAPLRLLHKKRRPLQPAKRPHRRVYSAGDHPARALEQFLRNSHGHHYSPTPTPGQGKLNHHPSFDARIPRHLGAFRASLSSQGQRAGSARPAVPLPEHTAVQRAHLPMGYFLYSPEVMLSIHAWLSRYQRTVFSIPSSNCSEGSHPSSCFSLLESIA